MCLARLTAAQHTQNNKIWPRQWDFSLSLSHHLHRLISVTMLNVLCCEWKESIHSQEEQQLIKIKSDAADEGDGWAR